MTPRRLAALAAVFAVAGLLGWLLMSALGRLLSSPTEGDLDPATVATAVAPA